MESCKIVKSKQSRTIFNKVQSINKTEAETEITTEMMKIKVATTRAENSSTTKTMMMKTKLQSVTRIKRGRQSPSITKLIILTILN